MSEGAPVKRTAFGPYQVRDLIAVSGMGVVYRAWDPRLECLVAIKLVNEKTVSDESARQQLLTEARIASSLDHQNICRIRHVEEADGQTGIVMELVEGLALNRIIPPHAGLPFEDVVHYGIEIASAIAHAHQHKVIHRDLKSGNVMVTPEGRIKLLDFGLSKVQLHTDIPGLLSAPNSGASSHTIVGTPPYWAPEVLKRAPSDTRSDLWSFGVLLYEMASGQMPFQGQTLVELGSSILRDPPRPLPSSVPTSLARIIQGCLLKEPAQRYQRASEIRSALEALQSDREPAQTEKWKWPDLLKVSRSSIRFRRSMKATSQAGVRSVAVLPLDNISGRADQEYFADGLTESLITTLAKVSGLRVISRTSIMRYKRVRKSVPQIARELGVDAIVEGSVLRVGDRVRITAELIQGATDEHLWAESYERDLRDIFALQSQVALAIAGEIRAKLTPAQMPNLSGPRRWLETLSADLSAEPTAEASMSQTPVDPKAYDLYLKGRHLWNIDKDAKAVAYYQEAIAIDPNSALTYAALAYSLIRMGLGEFGLVAPIDIMPKAKSAALEALNLDQTLAEAHLSLAMVRFRYEGDWAGAETEFVRAIELKDSDAAAHYSYSVYLMVSSRFDDALREVKLAQQLNPLSSAIHFSLGLLLYLSGQHEEAAEQLRGTTALYPTFPLAHFVRGLALQRRNRFDEAISEIEQSLTIAGPIPLWRGLLGHTYALAGRSEEALTVLHELLDTSKQRYVPPVAVALIYIGLGKHDDAFQWLDRSCLERDGLLVYLKVAAAFDGLRQDPRFPLLLTRLGFEENMKGSGSDVSLGEPPTAVSYKEQLERLRKLKKHDESPAPPRNDFKWSTFRLVAVVILVVAVAVAVRFFWPQPPAQVVLSVMPYKNLSGDPEAQQIAEGLTEEMVSGFGLLHPKRLSVVELAPAAISNAEAQPGAHYDSGYLLQGTVQVVQRKVAVTAQLVLTADQTRIWGDSYERVIRDPEDIIAIEIEIAGLVRNEVLGQLPADLHAVHQENPLAYQSYIEGRYFWNKRTTGSLQKALTYFEASIQKDPDYAPAYAGLADCYSLLGSLPYTSLRPQEAFPKAEAAAHRALELDPSLAEAYVSLGYADLTYEHDYPKAQQEFQQALRLRPNYPTAHQYYGYYLTAMGRLQEAIRERQEALDLDPLSPLLNSALGEAFYHAREYDRTVEANQKALNLDPGYAIAMINLARAYEQRKLYPEAGVIFQRMLAAAPDEPAILALAGHDYALAGNQPAALKLLSQLQKDAGTRYVPAVYFALIYIGLGEKNLAFQWLNKAYDEGCDYLINLPSEPFADPLRGDERFGRLLQRMGLNQITASPL